MNVTDRNNSRRGNNSNVHRRAFHLPTEVQSVPKQSSRRRPPGSPERTSVQHMVLSNVAMPTIDESSQVDQSRRKKPVNLSSVPTTSRSFIVAIDEASSDRGRKSKARQRHHNRHLSENGAQAGVPHPVQTVFSIPKEERSKSQDGPLAAAEFAKMKREIDNLRRLAQENKKVVKKQNKLIEELKQQENTTNQKLKETESQVQKLQSKSKKAEEFMNTAENNVQCQICMELLLKPYALSPCGHVLCVTCLQEWFRKAPMGDDDMDDVDNPAYILHRRKTCPCCRAAVLHRPIPIFAVKSIAAALAKAKGTSAVASLNRDATSELDPWEGIFPPHSQVSGREASEGDEGEEDDDDDDYEEDDDHSSDWYEDVFSYGTDSDEEPYLGGYVYPQWEPPTVIVDEDDYLFEQLVPGEFNALRRGATLQMLREYEMRYSHDEGLIAHDEEFNRYFLGWNIRLSSDDENGEGFMQYIMDDVTNRPERWRIAEYDDGTFDAHLLVREDEVHDYADTDSDYNYMDVDGR
ncbi:hypothetical protein F5J12DRAFT_822233 [Pisolithus orientalis]|uniref:uncharacterized protein n=1 Tax=Pisolithus orientalis TaxID=936130 RepID=UPI0022254812|nr:uncharacterized protein F5J12DRAFT_822233 [Pisolithus orientalis]KAI6010873.1 hypothetical protein F5J12DRAFT_822233 [Pisolithus orientalis]